MGIQASSAPVPPHVQTEEEGAIEEDAKTPKMIKNRKTYGGEIIGGRFVKKYAASMDDFNRDEQEAMLKDMELERQKKVEELEDRVRRHELRKQKQEERER